MKGWQIVKHSLRQVFGNMGGALRVSALLYLVQAAVTIAVGATALSIGPTDTVSVGVGLGTVLAIVIVVVTSLWIAVAWHRYILLGEEGAALPAFNGSLLWAYLLRSVVYGIILVVTGGVWGLIVGTALGPIFMGSVILGIIAMAALVYIPVLVLGFRLMAALPGVALGERPPFLAGWRATEGKTADLAMMAVIVVALGVAVQLVGGFIIAPLPVVNVVWSIAIGWAQTMVGASLLTTLYGHYIEGRALV